MELLFESRPDIVGIRGRYRFFQRRPQIHPEPVISPSTFADGMGSLIYGSVHHDGGQYRMWYQAMPEDWSFKGDISGVAHAVSDDGIHWRKEPLGLVEAGPGSNHLTDLGLHCPSIFIDPAAPPSHRYRATGCGKPGQTGAHAGLQRGYYTAASADGLHWEIEPEPRWPKSDVITSVYHPGRGHAMVAMKRMSSIGGRFRRSIYSSHLCGNEHTPVVSALLPDEFDDIAAVSRGGASADYYGMAMMPGGQQGMVGFLWQYWHMLPYTPLVMGLYGTSEIALTWQDGPHARWRHMPGRPAFITTDDFPQPCGWVYSASNVLNVGDEQRLYVTYTRVSHGWYLDQNWQPDEKLVEELRQEGPSSHITYASWLRDRIFGIRADPDATVALEVGPLDRPHRLHLNYEAGAHGHVRVDVQNDPQRTADLSTPLAGSSLDTVASWPCGDTIPATEGKPVTLRVALHDAALYAYELTPA